MTKTDIRFGGNEKKILKSFIGKSLKTIYCNSVASVNSSTQAVKLEIDDEFVYLYSFVEAMDYFGASEDVAVWSLEKKKYPIVDKYEFVAVPINSQIQKIILVQENQRLYKHGNQIYDVWLTRGMVFDFGDYQISFEKDVWFTEDITIKRGYDLTLKFASETEFVNSEWDDCYDAQCSRELIILGDSDGV